MPTSEVKLEHINKGRLYRDVNKMLQEHAVALRDFAKKYPNVVPKSKVTIVIKLTGPVTEGARDIDVTESIKQDLPARPEMTSTARLGGADGTTLVCDTLVGTCLDSLEQSQLFDEIDDVEDVSDEA